MQRQWDAIWINAKIATCEKDQALLTNAAIATNQGKIAWIGNMEQLPAAPNTLANAVYDVKNAWMTPGLVDCHTHLIYASNRADEFEMRLQGMSYQDIAKKGGGIQSTVKATRATSEDDLFEQSLKRARVLMMSGVTTLEIKSGYGLDLSSELKMLRVAKRIENALPLSIFKTFLGAHTVPIEYRDKPDAYVDYVCNTMIPAVAEEKLANAVDVFCENIAFNLQQTERIFVTAKHYHLAIKCHAEQLSDSNGALLAAKYHALSADHLEYANEMSISAMSNANTVAVLLPGAFYFLRETKLPPIDLLKQHHVPIALASDCNPGTSPILSLPLIMNMACVLFRLTPKEALAGVTLHAAQALGLDKTIGSLAHGKSTDFAIWDIEHPAELAYYAPNVFLKQLVKKGEVVM